MIYYSVVGESDINSKIINLIKKDNHRLKILNIVNKLDLPQCYVAAGFLRNLVWDSLHGNIKSDLTDTDIVYYDKCHNKSEEIERKLKSKYPEYNWEVRN